MPSADEECSASTSAFVTPFSSRCQSPLLPPADSSDPAHGIAQQDQQFVESLTSSLQEVEAKRVVVESTLGNGQADSAVSGSATGSSETCDDDKTLVCTADREIIGTASKDKQKVNPKKRLNGLVQDYSVVTEVCVAESRCLVVAEQPKGTKKQGKKKKKKAANDSTDSCDSSITLSDSAPTAHPSLKVPKELPSQNAKKRGKSHKFSNLESSSVSSASPSSSVCSHSPLAMSPSPISVEQSIHPSLHKILADGSNLNTTMEEAGEATTSEGKDEWPDLGMECSAPPKPPPGSRVHLHLEVEAKYLELSPEVVEREDSGCNMSVGSSESPAGGFKLQTLEQIAASSTYPVNWLTSEILTTQFNDPHLKSQQYLWCQRQQLHMFVQQHMEQQEQQTDKQIFYPIDPTLDTPAPPCIPQHMTPTLVPAPLFQHVQRSHIDPRPLFFPTQPSHDPQVPGKSSDVACPPYPPPPPPLPVHPYCPPASNKWISNTGEERGVRA